MLNNKNSEFILNSRGWLMDKYINFKKLVIILFVILCNVFCFINYNYGYATNEAKVLYIEIEEINEDNMDKLPINYTIGPNKIIFNAYSNILRFGYTRKKNIEYKNKIIKKAKKKEIKAIIIHKIDYIGGRSGVGERELIQEYIIDKIPSTIKLHKEKIYPIDFFTEDNFSVFKPFKDLKLKLINIKSNGSILLSLNSDGQKYKIELDKNDLRTINFNSRIIKAKKYIKFKKFAPENLKVKAVINIKNYGFVNVR